MTIQERLMDDLKTAMKAHDDVTKNVVRQVRSAIQYQEKDKGEAADDAAVVEVLARMVRQWRESIEAYSAGGRQDLVDKEEGELAVIMRYLPEQLGRDDILALATQTAQEVGAAGPGDKGKLMGKLMPQLRGKADGALVNTVVGELLDSLAGS